METIIESEEIKRFVTIDEFPNGDGNGYGFGSGYGYAFGDGYGYGHGDDYGHGFGDGYSFDYGYGYGFGDCSDYGYGYGFGKDIEYLNGQKIYRIDNVPTLIDSVHSYYAKGKILSEDLTTMPCYIAKQGNFFAHGTTLKQAFADVMEKFAESHPIERRIAEFNRKFPDRDRKYPASELFSWHHILTGSCHMGRKQFCKEHNLDYENGEYSVNEFISLTKNAYGGEIIRKLEQTL